MSRDCINRIKRNNRHISATLAQHCKKTEFLNSFLSLTPQRNNRNMVTRVCLFNYLAFFKDKKNNNTPAMAQRGAIDQMAKKYCVAFPCSNLAEQGSAYCAEHRPPRPAKETNPFYLTPQWRRFRDSYIRRHPLCEQCEREQRVTPSRMVDHIVPLEDGGAKTSDENAQALCWPCHGVKTASDKTEKHNKNHQVGYGNNRGGSAGETF